MNWLIVETCNKCHWIWHASNPKYVPLKPFWCIFSQSKINKIWNFGCFLNSPWQKTEKMSICTEKKCLQRLANLHIIGFWVCQSQCTMLDLCVISTFLSYYGFSAFCMGRSRYRVMNHVVGIKWDTRRTAGYVPSHFHGFGPHFLQCVS